MTHHPNPILPPPHSRTAQVAVWFAREIRSGRLSSGERLPTEQSLITKFNVSRTVIREAMASLRSEGLVVSRQGSGVFVADPDANATFRIVSDDLRSLADVQDILQLRIAVEAEAAGLAAERRTAQDLVRMAQLLDSIDVAVAAGGAAVEADFAFHRAISAATGNAYFERFMHFLGPVIIPRQSVRPEAEGPEQRRDYLQHVQVEHRRLFEAIQRRSVEAARLALREHLEAARERYRSMSDQRQRPGSDGRD